METCHKFKKIERFYSWPSLQNGERQPFEGSADSRRFLSENRSQECLPMNQQYWKFLHFCWKGEVYEFKTLPFGLATAPITFTKLLRPVAASLHSQGICLLIYLDDILVAAQTSIIAAQQMSLTFSFLESLGFSLNWKNCVLKPAQNLELLCFQVNTVSVTLSLFPYHQRN